MLAAFFSRRRRNSPLILLLGESEKSSNLRHFLFQICKSDVDELVTVATRRSDKLKFVGLVDVKTKGASLLLFQPFRLQRKQTEDIIRYSKINLNNLKLFKIK